MRVTEALIIPLGSEHWLLYTVNRYPVHTIYKCLLVFMFTFFLTGRWTMKVYMYLRKAFPVCDLQGCVEDSNVSPAVQV